MAEEGIVAIGLLTQNDVRLLGPSFRRLWPVEEAPQFAELLRAIDEADPGLVHQPEGESPSGGFLTPPL